MQAGDATGSAGDFVARLRAALPRKWFADDAPVLDAVLAGLADGWAGLHALLAWVRRQGRIATAEGETLDRIARDFFGPSLSRAAGQGDDAFRAAIGRELLRERATREALASVLTDLTGRAPAIFEPSRPGDTGGWGVALGYNVAGGYGSLLLPFQCFVTAYRPQGAGIASVAGYEGLRGDGLIDARAVSSRGTTASYFDAAGTLRIAPPGWARVDFSSGAPVLLAEAASVNQIRNPRAEGAVAGVVGAGGALPEYWSVGGSADLTKTVIGTGSESGIPFLDLRVSGTVGASSVFVLVFETNTAIPALSGQSWTGSLFVSLLAGSVPSARIGIREYRSTGADNGGGIYPIGLAGGALGLGRGSGTRTLSGGATTACVREHLEIPVTAGNSYDFTLRVGIPQLEQGAAATSPILPPAGAPAASKRDADQLSIPAVLAGGYGAGAAEYASAAMIAGRVTDADIMAAIARTVPAAAIAWTRISS